MEILDHALCEHCTAPCHHHTYDTAEGCLSTPATALTEVPGGPLQLIVGQPAHLLEHPAQPADQQNLTTELSKYQLEQLVERLNALPRCLSTDEFAGDS